MAAPRWHCGPWQWCGTGRSVTPEMAAGKRRSGRAYNGKAAVIGVRLSHIPPSVGSRLTKPGGPAAAGRGADRDAVDGLVSGLLTAVAVLTGTTRLGGWLADDGGVLGQGYVLELGRPCRRCKKLRDATARPVAAGGNCTKMSEARRSGACTDKREAGL